MNYMQFFKKTLTVGFAAFIINSGGLFSQTNNNAILLEQSFNFPSVSARSYVWWHWMNGNISKAGITADLESMKRVGIAGAIIFNIGKSSITNIPNGNVDYMSPEWLDMVQFASMEAKRFGLELGLSNSAGWSGTGGKWVTPENSMKNLVWSETAVNRLTGQPVQLPQPPTKLDFYRDVVVIAFPSSESKTEAITNENILNLTDKMDANGYLNWRPTTGDWTVLRFGYTTSGRLVRPAPESAKGLETDKMSRQALDAHWDAGVQPVLDKLGSLAGDVMSTILLDSYEAFPQRWTAAMPEEFLKRRGYDLIHYLPVLADRVVVSREVSDRFLWDFNRTVKDLFTENFYDYFAEKCHKAGLKFASEPYGNGDFDELQAGALADITMGEFWVNGGGDSPKQVASIAHTNGKKVVGSEAFTDRPPQGGRWMNYPGLLKASGDLMWCNGVNRFYLHSYPHQPWFDKFPGMTMGRYGTHFGRTTTWWEQSGAWMNYCARSQSLLQQGRFVADVLIFDAEGSSEKNNINTSDLRKAGYDYDLVGINLFSQLRVENGLVVLPSGMCYQLLVLNNTSRLTPSYVNKVRDLVRDGATVIAKQPEGSPSLVNFPQCDDQVKTIANQLWGAGSNTASGDHVFGKGHVIWGCKPVDVLAGLKLKPDFKPTETDDKLHYIHRELDGVDIYFISYQGKEIKMADCFFRVTGRQPELWNPLTGEMKPAGLWQSVEDGTRVILSLDSLSSVFVVFRKPETSKTTTYTAIQSDKASDSQWLPEVIVTPKGAQLLAWNNGRYTLKTKAGKEKSITFRSVLKPITLNQPWTVDFTSGWGAPTQIKLLQLQDWSKNSDPGVRYYSGTGIYRTDLRLPDHFLSNADRIVLDLGQVSILAEVILNGKNLGVIWCTPYRVDITNAAKAGVNKLEIRVTNLWPNRMIGDEQNPDDVEWAASGLKEWPDWMKNGTSRPSTNRFTFATWHHWNKDEALLPSGLLGPVQVHAGQFVSITK